MQGSIQKKNRTYYAVVPIGNKRKWFKGGPTKKDAERVLAEKTHELHQGTYKDIPKTTFGKFSDLWLDSYAKTRVKPATLASYTDIIKRLLKPTFGDRQLSQITTGHLQAYAAERLQKVSAKTVCNEIVVIKEMFKHAMRWGYVKVDAGQYVERPKGVKPDIEILEPHEVKKFLDCASAHYKVAFLTAVLTGLRAGELWGLRWGDIDWNSRKLYVRRSLWSGKFQPPKSKYSIRKVDLTNDLYHELKKWKLGCPKNEHDLVFPSSEGGISDHNNVVKRHFDPALRRAGLRHVSFHSLRHTNASIRIHKHQNPKYLSQQLGHSSIKVTFDIYGHLFDDDNFGRQQAELLNSVFESVRNPLEATP